MRLFLILGCVLALLSPAQAMSNYKEARKALIDIYQQLDQQFGQTTTLYCGCSITYPSTTTWKPNLNSCGYQVRKQAKRANRIEVELIMPAWDFGHELDCWKQGGRNKCSKNAKFKRMEGDLHNLYPAIGEINADRRNFPLLNWTGNSSMYGKCPMIVDFKGKRAQPPQASRGMIARAYLYMAQKYSIPLSTKQKQQYNAWNQEFPPSEFECQRNVLIQHRQGNANPYISNKCH